MPLNFWILLWAGVKYYIALLIDVDFTTMALIVTLNTQFDSKPQFYISDNGLSQFDSIFGLSKIRLCGTINMVAELITKQQQCYGILTHGGTAIGNQF